MDIASRLKALRGKRKISVYRLSKISEVSTTYIHEIESGAKQPTVQILEKICDALDISLSDFFKLFEEHESINSSTVKENGSIYTKYINSTEINQLIEAAESLSPEQIQKLTSFIKSIK